MVAELLERFGDGYVLAAGGLLIGLMFGLFAQRSRFCLRAAVIEFWHKRFGEKLAIWLLAFSCAVIAVQLLALSGFLDTASARQISARGSISGAVIGGLTFSGPSAEWLMRVLLLPTPAIGFEFGMLPGVFLGSLIGAWVGNDLKLEGFGTGYTMPRYIAGAVFMGFGAMLAGGCAVGTGVTGGAIFALTSWLSLLAMWVGAGLADHFVDGLKTAAP
jgi:hypothetical protein